ncbi:MAG: acyl carrier protein [Lachnospiraceae bacterium]
MEFEKLQEIISKVLNIDENEIQMDSKIKDDLGADSLDVFEMVMGIEEAFDLEIDNDDVEKIVTVGDIVEQIRIATNN